MANGRSVRPDQPESRFSEDRVIFSAVKLERLRIQMAIDRTKKKLSIRPTRRICLRDTCDSMSSRRFIIHDSETEYRTKRRIARVVFCFLMSRRWCLPLLSRQQCSSVSIPARYCTLSRVSPSLLAPSLRF